MNPEKRQKLEAAGWTVGSTQDFLGLTDTESQIVELKLALSDNLKNLRQSQHLSQKELAKKMKSSQSRVAKMEAGDSSVSIDLLFRAYFSMGVTAKDLAKVISDSAPQEKDQRSLVTP